LRRYTPRPDAEAYFKSTDGHCGHWHFSTCRLNWHVALLAAERGGCMLVDATRRGKTFPDALTKTVPMWCAVLNRAVAAHRQRAPAPPPAGGAGCWDAELHLPPWASPNEAAGIAARLPGWVADLEAVGADIGGLSRALAKPLRPLWLSQRSRIWIDEARARCCRGGKMRWEVPMPDAPHAAPVHARLSTASRPSRRAGPAA
jgi:tRNA A64-2'-O-ribosylphosphate transferase